MMAMCFSRRLSAAAALLAALLVAPCFLSRLAAQQPAGQESAGVTEQPAVSPSTGFYRLGPGRLADSGAGVRPPPANPEEPPSYKPLRYDEDYRYLKDARYPTDFWDPIKYVPLWGRDDWYLSLGGE